MNVRLLVRVREGECACVSERERVRGRGRERKQKKIKYWKAFFSFYIFPSLLALFLRKQKELERVFGQY